jgi:uncharacterized protein (TIGR01244 family)
MGMGAERFRRVAEDFWVAPQLDAADLAAARRLGVRTVINNRPDGEAADQPPSAAMAEAAAAEGLAYAFVPAPSGGITIDHVSAYGEGPFLAYCRTGTRSCHLWALSAARSRPAAEIVAAAAAAGYDLSAMRPLLERIHAEAAG